MQYFPKIIILFCLLAPQAVLAASQKSKEFDYYSSNRIMIRNGVQAVLMCNGLFTSRRTLEQVFQQELAYLPSKLGSASGGDYIIDEGLRAVAVGGDNSGPVIRAAFREGIGCIVMGPDQTFDDIPSLPALSTPPLPGDAATIAWPNGDLVADKPLPASVEAISLQAASDWAFDRDTPEQVTLSLIVLQHGEIIHERYAAGINMSTQTRTWSTAKSIAVTLIGELVRQQRMALDKPVNLPWLPALASGEHDPRNSITLRHLLNMSSGLYPVDSFGMEYATGSGLAYWAGASSVDGALNRGAVRDPGTFWDYENYDTLLAVYAMKLALGSDKAYREFPRRALLDKIGMRNTLLSTDRFGDFILSSQVYTNARDLARFGLLYAQDGKWGEEQLLSLDWIDFVRTPAPATSKTGNFYGGQWWLVPDDRSDVPPNAYATAGNRGQYVIVVPSHDLVIVRRGLDYGKQGFDRWDLTREILKAIKPLPNRI
ncbi:MAG: serine hydrolase [Proteobacteria bacterium]|nr:serine hydrolase [Pseudomonadota bacterium]